MEDLYSDAKIKILMNLKGGEIVQVCQTSKEMGKICQDERYNSLWREKILEDFNTDLQPGENGFNRYRELFILSSIKIYTVMAIDTEQPEESFSELFYTREAAEDFIVGRYIETEEIEDEELIQGVFDKVIHSLNKDRTVFIGYLQYKITEDYLRKERTNDFSKERKKMLEKSVKKPQKRVTGKKVAVPSKKVAK